MGAQSAPGRDAEYTANVLAWAGFIGKLLQFCVEKLVGKKLELALDQKRRSAAAFLRMYKSLQGVGIGLQ